MEQEGFIDRIRPQEEWDADRVVRAGKQIEELLDHPGWEQYEEALRWLDYAFDRRTVNGKHSESEYARMNGIREGLRIALERPHKVVQKMEDELSKRTEGDGP